MMVTAKFAMIGGVLLAVLCIGVAGNGFWQMRDMTDPVLLSDARGFALFWLFLGAIGVVFAFLSWRIDWTPQDERE